MTGVQTCALPIFTKAIVLAYPEELGKISLRLRLFPDRTLEIMVRDWGIGIPDVDKARVPLYTTGNEERSGMGFTIMESFMDNLKVRSRQAKGTTLVMRKRFSPRAGAAL